MTNPLSQSRELSDREVVEISAEICGFPKGIWDVSNHPAEYRVFGEGSWNPLEDANDAWKVLESVRKWRRDDQETFMAMLVPANSFHVAANVIKWFWAGNLKDISRAAAQAYLEQEPVQGRVYCRTCKGSKRVDATECLSSGWPKCCGYTMTIDPPESERE